MRYELYLCHDYSGRRCFDLQIDAFDASFGILFDAVTQHACRFIDICLRVRRLMPSRTIFSYLSFARRIRACIYLLPPPMPLPPRQPRYRRRFRCDVD